MSLWRRRAGDWSRLERRWWGPSLAFLLLAGCGRDRSPATPSVVVAGKLERPPSIVVVTIDTLRADHVHSYGYHRETSPHLDALAREGVLFERAYATVATTLPSHVSLFSGLFAHQHGVGQNRWRHAPFAAATGVRSAAQLLHDDGWTTAAFVSAAPVKRVTGVGDGFDVYSEPKGYERKGGGSPKQAIDWLEQGPAEPFLLWLHLWEPHEPNRPAPEWMAKFPTDEGLDRVIEQRRIDPARLGRLFAFPALRRFMGPPKSAGTPVKLVLDRDAVRDMLNRYDADVAIVDHEVGRLIDALRRLEILDRAIVVVTADHGQSLGQHDWLPHGRITDDNLRVPLVMRFPPGVVPAPRRVSRVVSMVDVLPTVLARFESEAGRRFAQQAEGEDALSGEPPRGWALAQRTGLRRANLDRGKEYALIADRFKLVRPAEGADRLYDLDADPGETTDVSGRFADVGAALARTLGDALRRRAGMAASAPAPGDENAVPEEHEKALRSLGYVDE